MSVAAVAFADPTEGWGFPSGNALSGGRCHYFVEGRSLCGAYVNREIQLEPDEGYPSPNDCVNCRRRFDDRS